MYWEGIVHIIAVLIILGAWKGSASAVVIIITVVLAVMYSAGNGPGHPSTSITDSAAVHHQQLSSINSTNC